MKFSKEASDALDKMKGKVGLPGNILCRIGFCLSLNDLVEPNPDEYKNRSSKDAEIDDKLILGHEKDLYHALLKQRCLTAGIPTEQHQEYLKAHMNRGLILLAKRVNNIKDIARLLPS